MKAWKIFAATAAMGALLSTPAMADVSTDIYYNDTLLHTTQPVVNVDGRILLAFRDLFENLDGQVSWNDEYRMASVTYGKNTIQLFPDTGAVQINGVPQSLAVGPQIINDRVYLPLRFVAQSLGGTVDYTKGPDDTGIIQIHTIDSTQNFAQKDGKMTTILRTTTIPTNTVAVTEDTRAAYQQWQNQNSVYFMDDHGNLVEVQSYDDQIRVNVIDLTNAKVESKTYKAPTLYPALTSVHKNGTSFTIGLNEKTTASRYVGVGTPVGAGNGAKVESDWGDMTLLDGAQSKSVFRFDASTDEGGVDVDKVSGKVLDQIQRISQASQTAFATASNGNTAFLLDGQLLIVDEDGDVKEDILLSSNIGDARLFMVDDQFVIIGVDRDMRYPDLYAAVYDASGKVDTYFQNIARISRINDDENFYEYRNLKLVDLAVMGNRVYTLLKTDMDYYVVTYDVKRNTSTKELLSIKEKTYSQFVYTMDDVKLFSVDEDYFYLRDID